MTYDIIPNSPEFCQLDTEMKKAVLLERRREGTSRYTRLTSREREAHDLAWAVTGLTEADLGAMTIDRLIAWVKSFGYTWDGTGWVR